MLNCYVSFYYLKKNMDLKVLIIFSMYKKDVMADNRMKDYLSFLEDSMVIFALRLVLHYLFWSYLTNFRRGNLTLELCSV